MMPLIAQAEEIPASGLILDPKHPGINDAFYIARRTEFYQLGLEYRLSQKGIPWVEYTQQEHDIWRYISAKLESQHRKKACAIYLQGKAALRLDNTKIPQLKDLDQQLRENHQIGLVPAEGLLDTRVFNDYLFERFMPCTQFLRHHSEPEYTPEPDAVHDIIGHAPPLIHSVYTDLIHLIGKGVRSANDEQLSLWARIYWFIIEFGLIQEHGETKVLGSGLLSSFGEMDYCFSNNVERKPFAIDDVVNTDYDPTRMQDILFVIPSLDSAKSAIMDFSKRLYG